MLLARKSQQLAGFSTLARIVGKFKVDKEYEDHVKLDLEKKYDLPLNDFFARTGYLQRAEADVALIRPQFDCNNLPYSGAPTPEVEAVKLPNGVTAVAVDSAAPIVSLGIYLGVGTRNENRDNAGLLQVVKNVWLGSTTRRTYIGGHREPAQCGANIEFTVGRDHIAITAKCARDKASLVLDHMTQNLICPEFYNHELHQARSRALHQAGLALANPDTLLLEEAYRLAHRGVGMGRSLYLNKSNAQAIDRDAILDFAAENLRDANNLAMVGVGLDSESVRGLSDEYLWSLEGGSASAPSSPWTGMRESHLEGPGSDTKILFLTKGGAVGSPAALELGVMRHLIGGSSAPSVHRGASQSALTSAAAPFAQHPFSVNCVNINNADSGMFGISVSGHGDEAGDILKASIAVVAGLKNAASDEQLQAAKNKLKIEIVSQRENSANLLYAAGVETLSAGTPSTTSQLCAAVDNISASDIVEMAKKVSTESPIYVSYGNLENLPLQRELR